MQSIIPRIARRSLSTSTNGAAAKVAQLERIDELLTLGRAGTDESNRSGIPMLSTSPWPGSRERQPWSFSFDPNGRLTRSPPPPSPPPTPSSSSSTPSSSASKSASSDQSVVRPEEEPLEPRRMSHSYVEINLPLRTKPELLAEYVSTSGGLRVAKLMEHLDSLAGAVAYKHILPPNTIDFHDATNKAAIYCATASADRLDLLKPLVISDLRLSGHVCYVGSSSMEVFIKMEDETSTVLLGRISMVGRDSRTNKARKVNPLLIETPAEQELFDIGRELKEQKQKAKKFSLPTPEEIGLLHDLVPGRQAKVEGAVEMEVVDMADTVTSSDFLMHPQERNLHGMVFGGHLMKLATELSYSNSVLFSLSPLYFLSLDEISFSLPIPIGSILRLTATVIHSTPDAVHSQVEAELFSDVRTGRKERTNTFFFTWGKEGKGLRRVVRPVTLKDSLAWLDGRRRLEQGSKLRSFTKA